MLKIKKMAILENKIGCSVDEDDDDIVIPKAIEVIMKLKRGSNKFLSALVVMDFDEMKYLQNHAGIDPIRARMEHVIEERTDIECEGLLCTNAGKKAVIVSRFGKWLLGSFWL